MVFFLIFLIIPLIEISLFITIGDEIGIGWTLLLCVVTALIGSALVRQEGFQTLFSAQKTLDKGGLPVNELFDGLCLVIAGVTLITPGFFTDAIGFALLVPAFRVWLRGYLKNHMNVRMYGTAAPQNQNERNQDEVIEVDYERVDDTEDHDNRG